MLGDKKKIRLLLRIDESEVNDEDIDLYLEMANDEVTLKFSTTYFDYYRIGNNEQMIPVYFEPRAGITKVILNDKILDPESYEYEDGFVTFTNKLSKYDELKLYYTPKLFDLLVNYMVCKYIAYGKLLNLPDNDVYKALYSDTKKEIAEIKNHLTQKSTVVGWVERNDQ